MAYATNLDLLCFLLKELSAFKNKRFYAVFGDTEAKATYGVVPEADVASVSRRFYRSDKLVS